MRKLFVGSVLTVLAVVGSLFLACLGLTFPVELLFNLAFGWAFYVYQTLPQVHLNAVGILTAAICLAALAVGLHQFLAWLFAHVSASRNIKGSALHPWPIRWTGAILGLIVLMFLAGLAAVGISHQTAWLITSPEPIAEGSMREIAALAQSQNNLKQMVLAMHNYQEAMGALPPAALWTQEGQPLLSWRVLILPYIEEENLFKEFRLHEPWDSPHNLRLLPRMPKIYRPLSRRDKATPYTTRYQVFVGRGAGFEGRQGLHLAADFPDGTANTLLIVEAADTVPWTKPEDLPYYPGQPLPTLARLWPDYCLAAMADGSVRLIKRDVEEQTLRGLVTRNGGETLDADW